MSKVFEELENWGYDVEGAMRRLGSEEICIKFIKMLSNDDNFEILGDALKNQDVDVAFRAAHTLKGVIANLGLTPMNEVITAIVEPLRAGNIDGLQDEYKELLRLENELNEIIQNNN